MAIVGIDAGGSKTRLVAVSDDGQLIADQTTGPANWATSSTEEWRDQVSELLAEVGPVESVVVCAAGIVDQECREEARAIIRKLTKGGLAWVTADYAAPLALVEPNDIVVIAGTGSVAVRVWNGTIEKRGGNGYLLGDEGSLFDIGRRFARGWLQGEADLGLLSETPQSFVRLIHAAQNPVEMLADLGRRYLLQVTSPDGSVLHDSMSDLAEVVGGFRPAAPIWLAGGVWRLCPPLIEVFAGSLDRAGIGGVPCKLMESEPVMGAVKLARLLFDEHGSPKSPLLQP